MIEGAGNEPPLWIAPVLEETRMLQRSLGAKLRQLFDEGMSEAAAAEFLEIMRHADRVDAGDAGQADGRPVCVARAPDAQAWGEPRTSDGRDL
jgi:hypothetical protein